jgi:hypothetical protein
MPHPEQSEGWGDSIALNLSKSDLLFSKSAHRHDFWKTDQPGGSYERTLPVELNRWFEFRWAAASASV